MQLRLLTILLFFVLSTSAQTPDLPLKKYAPAALKEDFLLLRDTLQKIDPGLYWYKSKTVLDGQLDSCYQRIRDSMTIYDFVRLIGFVVSDLEDGHADYELPRHAQNDLGKHIRMFPMRLWFTGDGDKAYVICEKNGLPTGTEIVSIDQHSIGEIINRVFDCLQGDGSIRTGKLHLLNDNIDIFSQLYYIVFGPKPFFTVEYRTPVGERGKTDLTADYDRNIRCDSQGEKLHGLALDFDSNRVAVLTVGRFDGKVSKFNSFLQQSFAEISRKQCRALIIDLRNNGGGEDQDGAALYSYLTNKPFTYYASLETVKRKFRPEEHPQLRLQQPAATPFLGDVYFLTNGWSFSGTAEFCAVARSEKRGVFIGEETGGGYYGNTSGDFKTVILPNTRISVEVGLVKYTMAVRETAYPDRGIIPDYPILPSFTDWIGHNDVQLKYALHLAGAN